jgi:hypothetical protein
MIHLPPPPQVPPQLGKDSIISVSLSKTLGLDESPTFSVNDNMLKPADSPTDNKVSEYLLYSRRALYGSTQDWQVHLLSYAFYPKQGLP